MTYQQKNDELQKLFTEKFDAYETAKKEMFPKEPGLESFLNIKAEFEKVNFDYQNFLILFKGNNALPADEYGTIGQRCDIVKE
jgi:hypothetical protein